MPNVTRDTPWGQQEASLKAFLNECGSITIPMNQRNYCWTRKSVDDFIDDMVEILKSNKKMCYGNVIQYKTDGDKEIWDGQQRIITVILALLAFRNFLENIFPHANVDYEKQHVEKLKKQIRNVTELDTNENYDLDDESTIIHPRINCVSPLDKTTLTSIINDYEPLVNFQDLEFSKCGDGGIKCRHCGEIIACDKQTTTDFRRHLVKSCKVISKESRNKLIKNDKIIGSVKSNKLLNAYEHLCYYIFKKCSTLNNIKDCIHLLLHDYIVNVKSCTDLDYVSKLYNYENNRGEKMATIDVVKNYILTNIPDDKKFEIFTRWEELKNQKKSDIYGNDYGNKIFRTAIQIYNKNMVAACLTEEADYKKLIDYNDKKNTYENTIKYLDIAEKLHSIMDDIKGDRYGRLVLHKKKGVIFSWEAYAYTILPRFYKEECIDSKFIEKLVAWQMYVSFYGLKETFNSLRYSNPLAGFLTSYLNNGITKEELDVKIYQLLNRGISGLDTNDEREIVKRQQFHKAGIAKIKSILAYIETKTTSSINLFDLDGIDHEHIVSQKAKPILTNGNLISSWGNITLLESKNTENVQTGNRGVQTSMFKKKESYTRSTFSFTRQIVEQYPEFFVKDIITENPNSIYDTLIQKRNDDIINKCIDIIKF